MSRLDTFHYANGAACGSPAAGGSIVDKLRGGKALKLTAVRARAGVFNVLPEIALASRLLYPESQRLLYVSVYLWFRYRITVRPARPYSRYP